MRSISIATNRSPHSYDIMIDRDLFNSWPKLALERTNAKRFVIIADKNVAGIRNLPEMLSPLPEWNLLTVVPGETRKNLEQYAELCEQVLSLGIDRKTVLVAIGGGVTGDMVGFLAATLLRGIRFIQIPTTLLAQVDSSVGGKTGVNAASGKNLVGAFLQPELVVIDPAVLDTLPVREYRAGLAEVVKTGILSDNAFFKQIDDNAELLSNRDHDILSLVIERCCRIKADLVAEDEFELGRRALLNLGHTFGHPLESLAGYDGSVVHGEAVAVGTALAAGYAEQEGMLAPQDAESICSCFGKLGLPTRINELGQTREEGRTPLDWAGLASEKALAVGLLQDKKANSRELKLILPEAIGSCRIVKGVPVEKVAAFMRGRVR